MKILIADDSPTYRLLLEALLNGRGYEVLAAGNGLEALSILQGDDAPRLAILDWMMPEMDGIQVCREIRKRPGKLYKYILLLTGKDRKEDVVEGLEAGADDYLSKPFDEQELTARLGTGRRVLDLEDQLMTAQEALRDQATHDRLTGLWNRGAILEQLEQQLCRGRREGTPLAVILSDIDHFKKINDTRGHLAGDAALRETARRLHSVLRPYDGIGRYGGEEFLIVLPGCDAANSITTGERLRHCVSELPMELTGGPQPVTISLGATACHPDDRVDVVTLLSTADDALYKAKRNGRNRVEFGELPRTP